jgi:hypothetical protein
MRNELLLKLSAQRALLGEVTPNMLAVSLEVTNDRLVVKFDFESQPSEEEIDATQCISTEILADFPEINHVEERIGVNKKVAKDKFLHCLVYLAARWNA